MNYDLEFISSLLHSKDALIQVTVKSFNFMLLDTQTKGFSPVRATCKVLLEFYKKYQDVLTIEQAEAFVQSVCAKEEQVFAILTYIHQAYTYTPTHNFNFLFDTIKKQYSINVVKTALLASADTLDAQDLDKTVKTIRDGLVQVDLITADDEADEGDLTSNLDTFYNNYLQIKSGEKVVGIPTGYPTFDELTGGLKAGELDIVMAGSNEGKSVFMLNVAHHVHARLNKNVIYFSVELPKDQVMRRYLSLSANINIDRLRTGSLTTTEEECLKQTMQEFKERKNLFYIADNPACTAESINATVEALSAKYDIDLIIIDYLGIMKTQQSTGQTWEDLGKIALAVRRIARTHKIPALTAMQVKQESVKNTKTPVYNMTDMASSFQVIYHADTVLSLKMQDPAAAAQGLSILDMMASIAKCRDGRKGSFTISAVFANMKMSETAARHV